MSKSVFLHFLSLFVVLGTESTGPELVAPRDLIESNTDYLMVDLRSSADFLDTYIPGSLHVPFFELKTKSWMRSKNLLLIDTGHTPPLEQAATLQALGFQSVSILDQGLYGWYLAGGPLAGDGFSRHQQGTIDSSQVDAASASEWQPIALIEDPSLPEHFVIAPPPMEAGALEDHLRHLLTRRQSGKQLLLVDREGELEPFILGTLHRIKDPRIWYLEGGLAAWHDHNQASTKTADSQITAGKSLTRTDQPSSKTNCGCGKK